MPERQIAEEAAALWVELFGEPPSSCKDGHSLLQTILENLPPLGYEGFAHIDLAASGGAPARRP